MTLLAVERIKLFTTRSPWWSGAIAIALMAAFAGLVAANAPADELTMANTQFGATFGLVVVMVLAALAITTEYRFGTIRATFQAVPNRTSALLAKTGVVAAVAFVIAEIGAFLAWGLANVIKPEANLALNSMADWRNVAGAGLIFALAAVVAVALGTLVRHSAGAIAIVLVYSQVAEPLISQLPSVGPDIYRWLPFNMAQKFLTGDPEVAPQFADGGPPSAALSPWWALAYFAAFAGVLLTIAVATANKRDA
ncbi:ABC-2 type transport system permease protein [Herbihabitans rhizosphaerae]|uniref:ABC-2 type transport system permease protein n=1 Tax=Herbihabitans rhizosphaerae TaxID=1872711 RepID=A0A4Q7KM16_9PSEU|nr:ABC transporter permease [Herbihabitans rhizosphaerae]RZS37708.1 ABC-2 type transport system permease protein [Herbihabitans rhizosphaerae]